MLANGNGSSPLIALNSSWLASASRYTMHHGLRGSSSVVISYRYGESGDILFWTEKRNVIQNR